MRKISTLFAKVRFDTDLCLDIVPKVWYNRLVPKLLEVFIMAKRWSFEEDYIVCTFCRDEYYEHLYDQRLLALMMKLEGAGFDSRSSGAVGKRMNYYLYLFDRHDVSYMPRQCRNIFNAISNRSKFEEKYKRLQASLEKKRQELIDSDREYIDDSLVPLFNDLPGLDCYIKGDSFQKLLFRFIDERGISDVEAYTRSEVSRFLFSQIRSDECKKVSKPTVLCFCIGLKLTYEESEALLKSAGFAFSGFDDFDLLVEEYITNGDYDIYEINAQLHSRNLELLYGSYRDYSSNECSNNKRSRKQCKRTK